jgi:cytochrome c oxidase accessory protein FixG
VSHAEGPSLEKLYSIRGDGSRRFLHPADVRGRFITRRRIVFAGLIAIYVALPLVSIGGHPAVQLNIEDRRFYLFGSVFNATDVWMVVFALLATAFGLLFTTAWLGRGWCGWACPQTVFLDGVYRAIERLVEGPGEKRIRLDQAPWSAEKLTKKIAKHAGFLIVSLFLSHVFLSLFVSGRSLVAMIQHDPRAHWEAFLWTMGITAFLYFNFSWFREQLCIVICPYGRLQSALVDRDSLVIGYDVARGEPRGKARAEGRGACVDCNRCVAVCPTGIDIRNGLQLECVACAQCIDACDEIMDKLGQPRGLVRYDSQRGLGGDHARRARPRLWAYGALFAGALTALAFSTEERVPFEAALLRAPGAPFVVDPDGAVRDQFTVHVVNKSAERARFVLAASGGAAEFVLPQRELDLAPLESVRIPMFAVVAARDYHGPFAVTLAVTMGGRRQTSEVRFLGPLR